MPTFLFEAMDSSGQEVKDQIEAPTEVEAQTMVRQMGYFVTKISEKRVKKGGAKRAGGKKRTFAIGGVTAKQLTSFTRQLSTLQDAGLPILRSLKILENQAPPSRFKNSLMDVCDEIEAGSTLSEAMAKSPKCFDRLFVNMIKAGEAGGALEIILQRLSEFQERSQTLKRKVKAALIYPVVVVMVAVTILTFIMLKIVPEFERIFRDFETKLPAPTQLLIDLSAWIGNFWFVIPAIPIGILLFIKLVKKFHAGRLGWDLYTLKLPVFGSLMEKNVMARTTRTLGTLVSSGVPILEALNITRETSGNAVFERLFGIVADSIREGESIAKPLRENARPTFHPVALMFWILTFAGPAVPVLFFPATRSFGYMIIFAAACLGAVFYFTRMTAKIVDDLVINMVDVGEETGELDKMLYKVSDNFDEEVKVLTDGLTKLMEPLLIVFLGGAVGFIVISLFLPLVGLISKLTK